MSYIKQAERLQQELAAKVISEDQLPSNLRYVGGADVEYDKETDLIAGAIVILDYRTRSPIEFATHVMRATFPYVPGLFSFREMPVLLEAYKKLKQQPELIICDAHGIAHPRKFGLASHLGIELDIPTIGCAKARLYGTHKEPNESPASSSALLDEITKEEIGKVLRTQKKINPVFVSVGHKITLATACNVVLHMTTTYRLPETTRLADQYAREALLKYNENNKP
jgi:deoxyribonuclease V